MDKLSPEAREAKNKYMREYMKEWRKKNKERTRQYDAKYWEKKAREGGINNG